MPTAERFQVGVWPANGSVGSGSECPSPQAPVFIILSCLRGIMPQARVGGVQARRTIPVAGLDIAWIREIAAQGAG